MGDGSNSGNGQIASETDNTAVVPELADGKRTRRWLRSLVPKPFVASSVLAQRMISWSRRMTVPMDGRSQDSCNQQSCIRFQHSSVVDV
jgi:hypothetical protein